MVDNYNVGKKWADTNVPQYLEKAKPYYLIAQEKTSEVLIKIRSTSEAAVVKLEEYVPGAQKQLNNLGDNIVKVGNLAIVKVQTLGGQAKATVLDVLK